MPITNESGPMIIQGQQPSLNSYQADYNPDTSISVAWGGMGILDPRLNVNEMPQPSSIVAVGAAAGGMYQTLDAIPSPSAVNNIVASAVPVVATPMTLTSTATSAVTKLSTAVTVYASQNSIPAGTLVLDTQPGLQGTTSTAGGVNSSIQFYSPGSALGRAVKVVSAGNDTTATFLVSGNDIYGYPMTEKITGVSAGTATGKKAFKFISSVVPAGTVSGSNVSVGTQDVFGLPIKSVNYTDVLIFWNSALTTSTVGFTGRDATSPASNTTGDVRGTYNVQSAADGTKKLTVWTMISPGQCLNGAVGLFGVTQV